MISAFGWLGEIAQRIGAFFPRPLIIKWSHGGVKYVYGKRRRVLKAGWHIYWPLVTEVETCAVCRQYAKFSAEFETQDGQTVKASGMTCYTVSSPLKFLSENENPYEIIDDIVLTAVREVIAHNTLEKLRAGGDDTDDLLTEESRPMLRPMGVRVKYTRLNSLARCTVLSLSSSSPLAHITVDATGAAT